MKKFVLLVLMAFTATQMWSQDAFLYPNDQQKPVEDRNFRIPLIGETAPSFTAESTNGVIHFPRDYGKSWKIIMSHPQDFTPVCSSEILELANLQNEFDKLGVKLVVVSVDPLSTHVQWKKALEQLASKENMPAEIKFPIVADDNLKISKEYGMIHSDSNNPRDVRGVYIVDPSNVIEAIYFYPKNVGRSTDELLRTVEALQTTYSSNVLTPVNWKKGNDVLIPYIPDEKLSSTQLAKMGIYNLSWFMWYKSSKDVTMTSPESSK